MTISTMSKINGSTLGKRLKWIVGALFLAALGGGVYYFGGDVKKEVDARIKGRELEIIMKANNYNLASNLVAEFESRGSLDNSNIIKLKDKLGKARTAYESAEGKKADLKAFEKALTQYDVAKASNALSEIAKSGRFSEDEVEGLQKRIAERTEEGLFDKIAKASEREKQQLTEDYLKFYPEGKRRKEVILEQLAAQYISLDGTMANGSLFDQFCEKLKHLNINLERFANEGINLAEKVPLKVILKRKDEYVSIVEKVGNQEEPKIGQKVLFARSTGNWSKDYLADRKRLLPIRETGELISIYLEGNTRHYVAKFPGRMGLWSKEYNDGMRLISKTEEEGMLVVEFLDGEIEPLSPLSEIRRYRFDKEMQKLERNLMNYGSGLEEPKVNQNQRPVNLERRTSIPHRINRVLTNSNVNSEITSNITSDVTNTNVNNTEIVNTEPTNEPIDGAASYRIQIGTKVIAGNPNFRGNWSQEYLTERARGAPIGSTGEVVEVHEKCISVKFHKHRAIWSESFPNMRKKSLESGFFVAGYNLEELKVIAPKDD